MPGMPGGLNLPSGLDLSGLGLGAPSGRKDEEDNDKET
jgi:hypothetical protein